MSPTGPRVVSLVPSVTETLVAWGRPPVACTRFCEQPGIPHVGGTKRPRIAAIVEMAPDLVVMCDEENRIEDHDALRAAGLEVHVASPRTVADVPEVLAALAAAVGVEVSPPPPAPPPTPPGQPRVAFVPIWARPWMTLNADTYGASVLAAAGWSSAWADDPVRYPEVTVEEVRARGVDAVLAPTEPWAFTVDDLPGLAGTFGARAVLVDGQDLFWWGARTEGAVRRLVRALA
ncbi:cobalamin-binding protein [Iamia sp. SCSIO 61187]|uniref:helical backbone metal receptor n=1 Tax=Iamia sp. SCSIO 61187 TaxID=2722752 RepID=UPI001C63A71F|nr:helical backbone metal receptor [Iamia sp. SCSIO 61187]QYG92622.1 cobalamin-binding protein [Iamia sp. SCSIO 61187]